MLLNSTKFWRVDEILEQSTAIGMIIEYEKLKSKIIILCKRFPKELVSLTSWKMVKKQLNLLNNLNENKYKKLKTLIFKIIFYLSGKKILYITQVLSSLVVLKFCLCKYGKRKIKVNNNLEKTLFNLLEKKDPNLERYYQYR